MAAMVQIARNPWSYLTSEDHVGGFFLLISFLLSFQAHIWAYELQGATQGPSWSSRFNCVHPPEFFFQGRIQAQG